MTKIFKTLPWLLVIFSFCMSLTSYAKSPTNAWKPSARDKKISKLKHAKNLPQKHLYDLDVRAMQDALHAAPKRWKTKTSDALITLPNADGTSETYRVFNNPIMHDDLAAKYPEIKSYFAVGVSNPRAKAYLSTSPLGFQSMTLHPDRGAEFIAPISTDLVTHTVYSRSESIALGDLQEPARLSEPVTSLTTTTERLAADDGVLRTLRLAVATRGEYTAYFGGNKALALAGVNNSITRVNAVLETDVGLKLILIANDDQVIFTDPLTDPYSNASTSWGAENQSTLDTVIGNANYDLGHLFGGSVAGGDAGCHGCICQSGIKGKGYTGMTPSMAFSDRADIDYLAHEIGHQLGASHTFTNRTEGANPAQMEPGSGSTIMSYAGITTPMYAAHSDAMYHAVSIQQITNVLKAASCAGVIQTGNSVPIVDAGPDRTIPKSTPFMLRGEVSDTDSTDVLTYSWEQMDPGNATYTKPSSTATIGPLFRPLLPSTSPVRYFPMMSSILAGATQTLEYGISAAFSMLSESLPGVARTLNFRLVVRDNHPNGSASNTDDVLLTVTDAAGPFLLISPNTAVTYAAGSAQTITWDVAGTTGNGVDAATVDILLSTDGGQTFPITLASAVPNVGSRNVVIPNVAGSLNRIMVKGTNHIFFDVSDANITITGTADPSAPVAPVLAASGTTWNSTNLSWNAVTSVAGVTGYDVFQNGIIKATTSARSLAIKGLTATTAYTFNVVAKDAAGKRSALSNTLNLTTPAAEAIAPTAPVLNVSKVTTNSATLTWSGATDNVGIVAYETNSNGGISLTRAPAGVTKDGLTAGTVYTFKVRAQDAAGNFSPYSNAVTITTLAADTVAPTAPTLSASLTSFTGTTLSWMGAKDNIGIAGYDIYQNGVLLTTLTYTQLFTYSISGLTRGTTYSYYIIARDAAGNTGKSNTISVTTQAVLVAPTLSVSGTTSSSTTLAWTPSSGASSYYIYRDGVLKTSTVGTSFTASSLSASTAYSFYVVAMESSGISSPASNTVSITTLSSGGSTPSDTSAPSAPTLAASNTTASSTNLSWSGATDGVGVVGYDVYQNGALKTSTSSTSLVVSGLSSSTSYSFYVKAKDAAGNRSAASNTVSVTTLAVVVPTDTAAPSAPTLTTSGVTSSSTNLYWSGATDAVGVTGYDIYQNGVLRNSSNGTNASITGLSASTTYSFYVIAKDAAGNRSAASNTVSVTTPAPVVTTSSLTVALTVPATAARRSTVTFSATASVTSGAVSRVEFYVAGTLVCSDTTAAYSCSWKAPNAAKTVTVEARAYDSSGAQKSAFKTLQVTR